MKASDFDPRTYFQHLPFLQLRRGSRGELAMTNLLAAATGLIAGFVSYGFHALIDLFRNLFLKGELSLSTFPTPEHFSYGVIFFPLIGICASLVIVHFFSKESEGHGVPEVIEAVMLRGGRMRRGLVVFKSLASSLTIATGGSVGPEGPIVQIGGAAGSAFGQFFKVRTKLLKILVACGATGAIAAAFNTPIAGVVFSVELILFELKFRSFVPLVISSVFATMVTHSFLGNQPAFDVPIYSLNYNIELLFYILLGILSGVGGVAFIRMLYGVESLMQTVRFSKLTKGLLAGLVVGGLVYFYPGLYGIGEDTINQALTGSFSLKILLGLFLWKMVATSFTLAGGGSGGVFAPSLFLGAMLGGCFGEVLRLVFPYLALETGAYVLVGMAAFFSATSRATLTAIIILFEMTSDYSAILPLMLACVVATEVAWLLSEHSIYSQQLARRGVTMVMDMGVNHLDKARISAVMTKDPISVRRDLSLAEAYERISKYTHKFFPVVDARSTLVGVVERYAIERAYQNQLKEAKGVPLDAFVLEAKNVAHPQESVQTALNRLHPGDQSRILVVSPQSQKLLGIVSPSDFVRSLSRDEDTHSEVNAKQT